MLTPDNRATFLEQLRPGAGRRLDHLLGTTFTVDLESALLPPLAFAEYGDHRDPLAMLASVHSSIASIDLFHQCGHAKVPSTPSALTEFLAPSLHAVNPPRGGLFHPKLWLARYVNDDEEPTYRLLVQSRNLTPDASWDLVGCFDGWHDTRRDKTNTPLFDLLHYLAADGTTVTPLDAGRGARIRALADAIRYVQWELPEDAKSLDFHVLGLPGRRTKLDFTGTRQLVVSPFLTDDGLDHVCSEGNRRLTVVSRPEALDQLDPEWAKFIDQSFVLDPAAGIPAPDNTGSVLSGLHAKAYVVEHGNQTRLFLGSANATGPAFTNNVEVLVEMSVRKAAFGIETLLGEEGMAPILLPYDAEGGAAPDPDDDAKRVLANVLRSLAAIPITATVLPGTDRFALRLSTDVPLRVPEGFVLAVGLTTRPGNDARIDTGTNLDHCVQELILVEITPFVTLTVTSPEGLVASTVVVATLVGDPPERLDEVIAAQLKSPEDFLKLIALLLSVQCIQGAAGASWLSAASAGAAESTGSGVLELLLQALARGDGDLESIGRIVDRLDGRDVLPDGFGELWRAVDDASKISREGGVR
ncbi:phospholipase D family protein [Rhodococcus sp. NPDC058521]|uniref:phospholipase D family protein n=1 Tax=Rhodococcus sp. NPDC058521 TaxID=3346536 RepID=UPI003661F328